MLEAFLYNDFTFDIYFYKDAKSEIEDLQEDLKDIEGLRCELADFFCEDVKTFKLEEAFRTMQTFCERFKKAMEVLNLLTLGYLFYKILHIHI